MINQVAPWPTWKHYTMDKKMHQIKAKWYYIFWGLCTVAVCSGQLYVGVGYRQMADSFDRIVDTIVAEIDSVEIEVFEEPSYDLMDGKNIY